MKIILTLALIVTSVLGVHAQDDTRQPPYKRFPTYPPLQILLGDSTTKFTKDSLDQKKPLFLMLFSPDCEHCQHEAEQLVAQKDKFKKIKVVMVTIAPLWKMNKFVSDYRLNEVPNIVVGKDMYYLLLPFYDVKNFPVLALYDKRGALIEVIEGSLPIPQVLEKFKD